MADDLGERTEEATPRRRQEARTEGQIARSTDLAAALLLLGATIAVAAAAAWMLGRARILLGAVLDGAVVSDPIDERAAWDTVRSVGAAAAVIAAPVLVAAWVAGCLAHLVQIGWLFAPKSIRPRAAKLNPLAGAKRIFGVSGAMKALVDAVKLAVVGAVAAMTVHAHAEEIVRLPYLALADGLVTGGRLMLDLALRLLAVLLLLGIVDFAWQRWRRSRDLRMTKQEVKEEMRQTEGDPDVRRRRLRMQQQIAMQRIGAAVPRADVVVTNPDHVSVALRYDAETMRAPKVVARGADYLALRIRQIAMQHGVPIVQRPPLARALYRQVAVGREVSPDFYGAVAEVLAYVYRLTGAERGAVRSG
jgi:flagellar biosynthetic protein FlhB